MNVESTAPQRTCGHIRASGLLCRAVALTDSRFCYFHAKAAQRRRVAQDVLARRRSDIADGKTIATGERAAREWDDLSAHLFDSLDVPPVEDTASFAVALQALRTAVETQQISYRRGVLLFRILRASLNAADRLAEEQQEQPSQQQTDPELAASPSTAAPARVTEDPAPLPHPFMNAAFTYKVDAELVPTELTKKRLAAMSVPSPSGPTDAAATG